MVVKGLKVGDKFTDGDFLYKIDALDSQGNYVSSLVGKAGEGAKAPKKEPKEVKEAPVKEQAKEAKVKKGV